MWSSIAFTPRSVIGFSLQEFHQYRRYAHIADNWHTEKQCSDQQNVASYTQSLVLWLACHQTISHLYANGRSRLSRLYYRGFSDAGAGWPSRSLTSKPSNRSRLILDSGTPSILCGSNDWTSEPLLRTSVCFPPVWRLRVHQLPARHSLPLAQPERQLLLNFSWWCWSLFLDSLIIITGINQHV